MDFSSKEQKSYPDILSKQVNRIASKVHSEKAHAQEDSKVNQLQYDSTDLEGHRPKKTLEESKKPASCAEVPALLND